MRCKLRRRVASFKLNPALHATAHLACFGVVLLTTEMNRVAAPADVLLFFGKSPMNITKLIFSLLLTCSALLAHALDIQPYSAAALAQAQKAGQPVALHFHADWCPTCRAQTTVLQSLKAESGLNITVLVADYDAEKDLKRRFNVRAQSTLVVLRGDKETYRVVGDTSTQGLRGALKSAL